MVNLGQELVAALPELRAQALSMMVDTCEIRRVTGVVTDEETGEATPTTVPVYEGPCKVATYEPYERNPEVAGATATVQRYALHVPVGSFRPEIGMYATVTASQMDPHLAGRVFRVVALLHKTFPTAYRLGVEVTE